MQISPGAKLVFMGDSITEAGRDPSGEATPWANDRGFGRGYVGYFQALLEATHPTKRIRVINRGVSGNTILDVQARWDSDAVALAPQWLAVMIGINDVWRKFDCPLQPERHVPLDRYEKIYGELIASIRPHLDGLLLAAPYVVEPNRDDPMRRMMDDYGTVVRRLAAQHDAIFVDPQQAIDNLCETLHPTALAWDRIHLNATGHMTIARAFLNAIEYSWQS